MTKFRLFGKKSGSATAICAGIFLSYEWTSKIKETSTSLLQSICTTHLHTFCEAQGDRKSGKQRVSTNDHSRRNSKSIIHAKRSASWDDNWDYPEPEDVTKKGTGSKAVKQIVLIRHGQYDHGDGKSDHLQILTPLGRKQAVNTGKRLKEVI